MRGSMTRSFGAVLGMWLHLNNIVFWALKRSKRSWRLKIKSTFSINKNKMHFFLKNDKVIFFETSAPFEVKNSSSWPLFENPLFPFLSFLAATRINLCRYSFKHFTFGWLLFDEKKQLCFHVWSYVPFNTILGFLIRLRMIRPRIIRRRK